MKSRKNSLRQSGYNYNRIGCFFVTACTHGRQKYFGKLKDGVMYLSPIGHQAYIEWYRIPVIRPDMNIRLGEFVVMPDHIHGIIGIGRNKTNAGSGHVGIPFKNQFGVQRNNLASIMRGYKSAVMTFARIHKIPFNWQRQFRDHIIRDPGEYHRISRYIRNNPGNG